MLPGRGQDQGETVNLINPPLGLTWDQKAVLAQSEEHSPQGQGVLALLSSWSLSSFIFKTETIVMHTLYGVVRQILKCILRN